MDFYADENGLYEYAADGAIKITHTKYLAAFDHLINGGILKLHNGALILTVEPENREGFEAPVWQDGEWHFEPIAVEPVEPIVPTQVTRAQGKYTLIQAGIWPAVIDYMNAIEDPIERALADVALNDTTHWQRNSPFLNAAASALGVTEEQLDAMFISASMIEL